jgi:hypothetical protein
MPAQGSGAVWYFAMGVIAGNHTRAAREIADRCRQRTQCHLQAGLPGAMPLHNPGNGITLELTLRNRIATCKHTPRLPQTSAWATRRSRRICRPRSRNRICHREFRRQGRLSPSPSHRWKFHRGSPQRYRKPGRMKAEASSPGCAPGISNFIAGPFAAGINPYDGARRTGQRSTSLRIT